MIRIDSIDWNRSSIEFSYHSDQPVSLYLYRVVEKRFIPLKTIATGDGYISSLNIVNDGQREVLPAGKWIVCTKIDEDLLRDITTLLEAKPHLYARMERDVKRHHKELEELCVDEQNNRVDQLVRQEGLSYVAENPYDTHGITYSMDILNDIGRYSRVFRYAKNTYAYTVSLVAGENSEGSVYLALEPEFFMRNKHPKERHNSRIYKIKRLLAAVYRVISIFFNRRRNGKRILFFKQNGDAPTENMAALQQRIVERGIDKQFHISCRYHNVFSGRQKPGSWLMDFVSIASNDYIFIDDYAPLFNFIDPPEGSVLTQLWHAGVGFKSVGYARFGLNASPDPYASGHRKYTYALVGNAGLREIYSEVFGIEPEALLATGMPRLDHFLDQGTIDNARSALYSRYPQLKSGRVILFAPTFRGAGQKSAYYPYQCIDMKSLHEMCVQTNSYFIFEMHHFITESPSIDEEYADRILDLSNESLNELFHISDVLVTDYSSCFYDYLLLKKPIVFFTPDREVYSATRGVQRPIEEMAPGVVCDTFDHFMEVLGNLDYEFVAPDPSTVDRASECGSLASDRVIDAILLGKDVPGVRMRRQEQ